MRHQLVLVLNGTCLVYEYYFFNVIFFFSIVLTFGSDVEIDIDDLRGHLGNIVGQRKTG